MTTERNILVVEDETDLAELICFNLHRAGFQCRCAANGTSALDAVARQRPDLILLDRMLPVKSGDDVLTALRRRPEAEPIPVIMLTAKVEESDELAGFELGADDYIRKPFSMRSLVARVNAVLRRANETAEGGRLTAGPISLDDSRVEVTVDGKQVSLTSTEFRMLKTLMRASGRVLGRAQLIDAVLGPTVAVTDRTIDVHMVAVRRKLGPAAAWIQTVRGVGYTFRPPG